MCDIQWAEPTAGQDSAWDYVPFAPPGPWMQYGRRMLPAPETDSPPPPAERALGPSRTRSTAMGLHFGIHIMRGVPRLAVHTSACPSWARKAPPATRIASRPHRVCKWNTDMYGVDASESRAPRPTTIPSSPSMPPGAWISSKVDDICQHRTPTRKTPMAAEKEIEMISPRHRRMRPGHGAEPCPPGRP